MFGPMMYLTPSCWVRRSAPDTVSLGSFLSSIGTISILYFSPPMSTPPLALYMLAVASAQYLLVRPQDAAGPLITPSTPIFSTSSAAAASGQPAMATPASAVPTSAARRVKVIIRIGSLHVDCRPRWGRRGSCPEDGTIMHGAVYEARHFRIRSLSGYIRICTDIKLALHVTA